MNNTPATRAELAHIATTTAQGIGFLLTLALREISPESASRFYDAVNALPQDGSDFDLFIEQAIAGMDNANAELDQDIED